MIRHELKIRYAPARLRPTVAWLVPGEEVESWLRELVGWDVDLRDMTLRPIPRSRRDATACGVLVTLSDGCIPKLSARCQEYGRIAQRCFLPVQARLEPGVVESEVASLLEDSTSDYVFHPAIGLVIVRDEQKLSGADLLKAPRAVPRQWDRACPGEALVSRLALVEPQMRTSLEEFFREEGDDIGSRDLSSAPWSSEAARSLARKATESGGAEERGILSRLADAAKWAIQSLRGVARSMPSPGAQLDGLLRLLERDPDEGLRYAVPLTDPGRRRGTPDAGGVLARHAEPQRARTAGRSALRLYPNWFFDLPAETTWCTAASDEQAWYFAGYGAQRLIVTRVPWLTESASLERLQWSVDTINEEDDAPQERRGEFEQLQWPLSPGLRGQPILLCPDPRRQAGLLIHVVGGQPLTTTTQRFRETDNIPRGQLIGAHRGFTLDTRGVARSLDGITWLATAADSGLSLATYSPEEQRLGTCELPPFLAGQLPAGPVHVLAGLTHVMLGFGSALYCLKRGVGIEMVRLPSPLRALCAAPGEYPHFSVVICDRHLAVLWHARKDNHLELLQDDVSSAVCGFTRQGRLFVVQTGRFEIYEPVKDNLQLRGSGTLPLRSPIAVLATPQPDQILVCSESGQVMRAAFA